MTTSTRFPVAVHILTVLAAVPDEFVNSKRVAKSIGTHPVVIRRILGLLQDTGFVTSFAGAQGGSSLIVDPDDVTLLDIYRAVEPYHLIAMHEPDPKCPISRVVNTKLAPAIAAAETALEETLAAHTLAELTRPATNALRASLRNQPPAP